MKKHHATEVDRIIAGIQSRSVSRRQMIAENEKHYEMLRAIAKVDPDTDEARAAGMNGRKLRNALNAVARDQKLDKATMKLLRDAQLKIIGQARQLQKIITQATIAFAIIAS